MWGHSGSGLTRGHRRWRMVLAGVGLAVLAAAAGGVQGSLIASAGDPHSFGPTLWVSAASGSDSNTCTHDQPCRTIGHAVAIAPAGATIKVEAGTYDEGVTITTKLQVEGLDHPVVDAASATQEGCGNGFLVSGPGASGTEIKGFTVEDAQCEGILVQGSPGAPGVDVTDVTIDGNRVIDNDTGLAAATAGTECASPGPGVPGDCGEGIHLWTVSDSRVDDNTVESNAGGILLTDEFGPTFDNVVQGNTVLYNLYDCGITLAGHGAAVGPGGPTPTLGGVYDNTIKDNVSYDNGGLGEGGGILMAAAGPGGGVYDNTIAGNDAEGDGLAGIDIHSHFAGQDLNGNVIVDNTLRLDNIAGDATDFTIADTPPTGILVGSGLPPGVTGPPPPAAITGTVIKGNRISDVVIGIWTLNAPLSARVVSQNHFAGDVTTPLDVN